ncbi:hypothetical protein [Paenibacillus sp. GYB003]|uniref:hypothetical protein n=1 Tax=Paenibacillus sp. GYB003 TaxID=2994392 RepID=UPI002F9621CE
MRGIAAAAARNRAEIEKAWLDPDNEQHLREDFRFEAEQIRELRAEMKQGGVVVTDNNSIEMNLGGGTVPSQ